MTTSDLDRVLTHLAKELTGKKKDVRSPFLYLDPASVLHIYQELTGLNEIPRYRLEGGRIACPPEALLDPGEGPGLRPPLRMVFDSLKPVLEKKVSLAGQADDLKALSGRFVRVHGMFRSTRFPDGDLNLEIAFLDLRGVLFYNQDFFCSLILPLLESDRIFSLNYEVEALVFVLGEVRRTIFYHPTYGDNQEYEWVPLAPVVIQERPLRPERG